MYASVCVYIYMYHIVVYGPMVYMSMFACLSVPAYLSIGACMYACIYV